MKPKQSTTIEHRRARRHSPELGCDVRSVYGHQFVCHDCGAKGKVHRTVAAARAEMREHVCERVPHCPYCGERCRGRTCAAHSDLPALEPPLGA